MSSYEHNFFASFICEGHESEFEFTFDMTMTSRGYHDSGPSISRPGEPGESAEWEIDEIQLNLHGAKHLILSDAECIALIGQTAFDKHLESAVENANDNYGLYNDDWDYY